jgi:hypothetical protein
VSQIAAQETKVNLWEFYIIKVDVLSFILPNNKHLASIFDLILTLGWDPFREQFFCAPWNWPYTKFEPHPVACWDHVGTGSNPILKLNKPLSFHLSHACHPNHVTLHLTFSTMDHSVSNTCDQGNKTDGFDIYSMHIFILPHSHHVLTTPPTPFQNPTHQGLGNVMGTCSGFKISLHSFKMVKYWLRYMQNNHFAHISVNSWPFWMSQRPYRMPQAQRNRYPWHSLVRSLCQRLVMLSCPIGLLIKYIMG